MQVETFECEETRAEHVECSDEAIHLIESLGLEGQKRLVKPAEGGKRGMRCPYRQMTADEQFVYQRLCPTATPLESYAEGPIPLRVLQVIAHARELKMFDKLVVWSRATPSVKDPVLVGIRSETPPGWSWSRDTLFILARWGEALDEWPAMERAAMESWRGERKAKLRRIGAEVQAALAVPDDALTMEDAIREPRGPSFS